MVVPAFPPRPKQMRAFDRKLFKARLNAVEGREQALTDIKSVVQPGVGRHAVRAWMKRVRSKAYATLSRLPGPNSRMLDRCINLTGLFLHDQDMENSGNSFPGLCAPHLVGAGHG